MGPDTAERACRGEIPDLVENLLASCRSASPLLLDRKRQARHNVAGETHVAMLNFAIDEARGAPNDAISSVCNKAFLESHSGYGLRTYIMEIREHERKSAMLLKSADDAGCKSASMSEASAHPIRFLDRDIFDANLYHPLHLLFVPRSRHLSFAQQDLLVLALRGDTDEKIAAELNIGRETVRKRWAAIFERAEQALPFLFSMGTCAADKNGVRIRGNEKRRPLLIFLAENPQELRP